ncbi:MAG: hypothetical protein RMX68_032370 [Aulosira sp. ZfuVER01]|nr:hypothetical protein [Aulosira sp. ZfuVER01]MDZ8000402.1 hypothetical protein [Aulosira sp. DedVER01a]MDZ8052874.1 hypothetical protein [Aulosira sp. ZfuCHP01]
MNHPFGLNLSDLAAIDLDFPEPLTDEEAAQVQGGSDTFTTLALGEEGGDDRVSTKALGEEGGSDIACISTPCPGSETGGISIQPKPPVWPTQIKFF